MLWKNGKYLDAHQTNQLGRLSLTNQLGCLSMAVYLVKLLRQKYLTFSQSKTY